MRCQACGHAIEATVGDEAEAYVEMVATFGELPRKDQAVVCDACYGELMACARAAGML